MTKEPLTAAERRLLNAIAESTIGNEPLTVAIHRRAMATNPDYRQRVETYVNPAPIDYSEAE